MFRAVFSFTFLFLFCSSCVKQDVPKSGDLNYIHVINYEETNSLGELWDGPGDYADLYIKVDTGNTNVYTSSTYFINAQSPGDYVFAISPLLNISDFSTTIWVDLYDYDSTSLQDQLIGSFPFYIEEFNENFTSGNTIDYGTTTLQADMFWYWK
jgi:hypothetical protein